MALLRQREAELRRANRALRTISSCNQALIHANVEQDLLDEVCRVIVQNGGYRLAWVGYAEHDERKTVRPLACAGYEAGYLAKVDITWADEPRGRGPTGTAIRTRRPAVCRDVQTDPKFAPWRDDARQRGYASSIVLPLLEQDTVLGALSIYATESDAFDPEEVKLLEELAGDLAFGITALRARQSHQAAVDALRQAGAYNRRLIEASLDPLVTIGSDGRITDVNAATEHATGRSRAELIGTDFSDYFTVPDDARVGYLQVFRDGLVRDYPLELRHRDGSIISVLYNATVYRDERGQVIGVFAAARDVTERQQAERRMREALTEARRFREALDRVSAFVYIKDAASRYVYANQPTLELFGCSAAELAGRDDASFFPPETVRRLREVDERVLRGEHTAEEITVNDHEGKQRVYWEVKTPLQLESGGQPERGLLGISTDITWIKQAEAEQRQRELELRQAQRIALVGSWRLNLVTGAVTWSEELYRMYGLDPARSPLDYQDHHKLFTPESWERLSRALARTRETGEPYELELEMVRADGRKGWMIARGEAQRDARGVIVALHGVAQDITGRKLAEAALQESEAKFSAAFNLSPISLTLTSAADGTFRDVNEIFLRDTGYTREEVIGRTVEDLGVFADAVERERLMAEVQREGRAYGLPCVFRMKSGKQLHCLTSSCLITIGGQQYILSAILDITERKRTEEELQFRNILLSTQQETSNDGILVVDEKARILSCNRRFIDLWRIPPALIEAKDDEALLRTVTGMVADQPGFLLRVQYLNEHREETSHDELVLADGRVFERYSAPMFGPQDRYYGRVWYFHDITERKRLEAQFLQVQKMEAFGQLAGGVAHDFNNILGVMIMQLNLLQLEPELSGKVVSGLAELERCAMRGAGLTRQLLMFSRRQQMQRRVVDLNLLLEDVSKMLRRVLGEHIAFAFQKAATPLWIEADTGMIEQVLMNLCINARDAMAHGGRLTIETRPEERRPPAGGAAGAFACLAVTDTGCGMDEATKARIFEPFFTTKPVGHGTGIGLATVYGIVQQHRGWVEVDSAPNKGTTFRVYFPLRPQGIGAADSVDERKPAGGYESILLVEDEVDLRSSVSMALRLSGYRVVEAANGPEALAKWSEVGRAFDLLLTDFLMPEGMTGAELAAQLRHDKDSLKVIVMSGYIPGSRDSATPFPPTCTRLAKPFEVRALLQTVRQCLDGKPAAT